MNLDLRRSSVELQNDKKITTNLYGLMYNNKLDVWSRSVFIDIAEYLVHLSIIIILHFFSTINSSEMITLSAYTYILDLLPLKYI